MDKNFENGKNRAIETNIVTSEKPKTASIIEGPHELYAEAIATACSRKPEGYIRAVMRSRWYPAI